ncbi:hypothetical protein OHB04_22775 [Streptomyces sp. NBC_01775]|uniref:hypothetical protein n=1 Tax=Streptomyces sp. NBC_01775 TaxID=2975939 RepID=UPI002DD9C8A5|nr:hypothetical protein [Streptomyces sp. NBC_01775]WSB78319.1 hypothetical protein OHB04_22775 [Streptomyces sp. NBC_01775]
MQPAPVLVDIYTAAQLTGIKPGTLRVRLHRGALTRHGHDRQGRDLIDFNELCEAPNERPQQAA